MTETLDKNRLRWACRRGMLELDLILENYFDHYYDQASKAEQQEFITLLEEADQDLFDWIIKKQEPKDAHLKNMIIILSIHGAKA